VSRRMGNAYNAVLLGHGEGQEQGVICINGGRVYVAVRGRESRFDAIPWSARARAHQRQIEQSGRCFGKYAYATAKPHTSNDGPVCGGDVAIYRSNICQAAPCSDASMQRTWQDPRGLCYVRLLLILETDIYKLR
jgi:hypothetical protein